MGDNEINADNPSDKQFEQTKTPGLIANVALSLLNIACYLLDRQVKRLADDFTDKGGFSERLYRVRTENRKNNL